MGKEIILYVWKTNFKFFLIKKTLKHCIPISTDETDFTGIHLDPKSGNSLEVKFAISLLNRKCVK